MSKPISFLDYPFAFERIDREAIIFKATENFVLKLSNPWHQNTTSTFHSWVLTSISWNPPSPHSSHSAHSPGVLGRLIIGMISHIYRLTTNWQDKKIAIRDFFLRLANRGYASTALRTHFTAALLHLERPTFNEKWWEFEKRCFLHLPFHPDDPSSRVVQRLFRQHLLSPTAEPPLPELRNHLGHPLETNRLIIAYHRPNNLRNLLFPWIFQGLDDRPVSSFLPRQPAPGI